MRRGLTAPGLMVALALVVGACAVDGGTETVVSGPTTSDAPAGSGSSAPDVPATSAAPGETTTTSDREVAPDFTLELGDGGEYTLSEGEKPVYLVFWAEW